MTDRDDDPAPPRPATRADCADGPRPCPWVGCRHHTCEPHGDSRRRLRWWTPLGPCGEEELPDALATLGERGYPTCVLDVVDARDGEECSVDQVGLVLGLSGERVRQILACALASARDEIDPGLAPGG